MNVSQSIYSELGKISTFVLCGIKKGDCSHSLLLNALTVLVVQVAVAVHSPREEPDGPSPWYCIYLMHKIQSIHIMRRTPLCFARMADGAFTESIGGVLAGREDGAGIGGFQLNVVHCHGGRGFGVGLAVAGFAKEVALAELAVDELAEQAGK